MASKFVWLMLLWLSLAGAAQAAIALGRLSEEVFASRLIHAVFDEAGTTWLLTSRAKEPAAYLTNPDGSRAQLRRLELLKIDPSGTVSMSALGEVYGAHFGALWVENGRVLAFQNSVEISDLTAFAMEGFLYTVDAATLALKEKRQVFRHANHGWWPVIHMAQDTPIVMHFSFAGYLRCLEDSCLEFVTPETMSLENAMANAAQAPALITPDEAAWLIEDPNPLIRRLLARHSDPQRASTGPTRLPPLSNVHLPLPSLPALGAPAKPMLAAGRLHSLALETGGSLWAWGSDRWGELGIDRKVRLLSPALVEGAPPPERLAAGWAHTLLLTAAGELWAWGANESGQLGDGSHVSRVRPTRLGEGYSAIAAGSRHSLALARDGTLWAWGSNSRGQLGDGSTMARHRPVLIGAGFSAIAAGDEHSLALKSDGSLWAWGANDNGQLGDGSRIARHQPIKIGESFSAVFARGAVSMALDKTGKLWAWGANGAGELGIGTRDDATRPTLVRANITTVAIGWGHALALTGSGELLAWGRNFGGQIGDGTRTSVLTPKSIGSGFSAIAAGASHSLGLTRDGRLYAWGYNVNGMLGTGNMAACLQPCFVTSNLRAIAAGGQYSLAVDGAGRLLAWGDNAENQLGVGEDAASATRSIPRRVALDVRHVAAGGQHSLAIQGTRGKLLAWGHNANGQLGHGQGGYQAYSGAPVTIGEGYVSASAGEAHSLALKSDGSLWAWGYNTFGQLGNQDGWFQADQWQPVRIGTGFAAIAAGGYHSLALKSDGSLWAWGNNYFGQLGLGQHGARQFVAEPLRIGTGYAAIAAGRWHSLALKSDGSLWGWGHNLHGQLGTGESSPLADTPQRIGDGFIAIAAGDDFSAALRADGTLWLWGDNRQGQLGDGTDVIQRGQAGPVAGQFSALAAGGRHMLALRADGTVRSWGANASGQLGEGSYAWRAQPSLVLDSDFAGFLDLDPAVANDIARNELPPFLARSTLTGSLQSQSLVIELRGALGGAIGGAFRSGYKVYVAEFRPGGQWRQLEESGLWTALSWPMAEYLSHVNLATSLDLVTVEVLNGADLSQSPGSRFYVGYGRDADEMLAAGRYREVLTVEKP